MLTPELARASLHAAAAAGDLEAARACLARGAGGEARVAGGAAPSAAVARAPGGPHGWEPLLYLAYSRVDRATARSTSPGCCSTHGADPNAGFLWDGLPSPFTALTGAFGRGEGDPPPHRDALPLARLLLEAGADPTDTQATYNLHWTEDDAWLELLLEFGYGRGDGGPWHARLAPAHPTPRETAEDCLMWAALEGFPRRVTLLLERRRRPRRPGHPPPGPQGPHGARGRPARGPHRGRRRPARGRSARAGARARPARRGRLHGRRRHASPTRRRPA